MTTPDLMLQSLTQAQQGLTQQALQKKVLQDALSIGTVGLGLGVGARGLWGLAQQVSRNARKRRPTVPAPIEVEIPVEELPQQEKLAVNIFDRVRLGAEDLVHGAGRQLSRSPVPASSAENTGTIFSGGNRVTTWNQPGAWLGPPVNGQTPAANGPSEWSASQNRNNAAYSQPSSPGFKAPAPKPVAPVPVKQGSGETIPSPHALTGGWANTASGVPFAGPLWAAAGLGSVGAGWKLTDWLLDKRRRKNMRQELDAAKQEYNDALYGKTAEALGEVFDKTAGGVLSGMAPPEHEGTFNGALAGATAGIPAAIGTEGLINAVAKPFGTLTKGSPQVSLQEMSRKPGPLRSLQRGANDLLGERKMDWGQLGRRLLGRPTAADSVASTVNHMSRWFPHAGATTGYEAGRAANVLRRLGKIRQFAPLAAILGLTTAGGMVGSAFNKKQADLWNDTKSTLGNMAGQATGAYGTYAGLSGLAAGLLAYGAAKKRQRRTLLESAQKERQRQRYEAMPTPIYAVPVPVAREPGSEDQPSLHAGMSLT